MSTFELTSTTKAKLTDVVVLSQKNRQPDENPGAKLSFETSLSNHMLAQLDPSLKAFLYVKHSSQSSSSKAKQTTLEGVEEVSDLPNLSGIGAKIGWLHWGDEFTGYSLVIDLGLGGKRSNLEIDDCTVSGLRIAAQEGGTFKARYNVESANVTEAQFGKLAKLKSREIQKTLVAPEVAQQDLDDDDVQPAPARKPGAAERAAVDKVKGVDEAGMAPHKETKPGLEPDAAWPFPKGDKPTEVPPQSVTIERSQPGTRTARGMEKTKAALAKGTIQ